MIGCLPRPQGGLKPVSAHFRTSGTTSGETFVVTDGPLKSGISPVGDSARNHCDFMQIKKETFCSDDSQIIECVLVVGLYRKM